MDFLEKYASTLLFILSVIYHLIKWYVIYCI